MSTTPEQIEYIGLFVDDSDKLLSLFPAKHENVFAHHSTNWYKPTSLEGLGVGSKSVLKIIGEASDERGYALLVENPKSKNKFPHITISCAEGTQAVYSNELLENAAKNGTLKRFDTPFEIEVTEGYVDMEGNLILSN